MKLLALDPSSTCTGYAIGTSWRHLLEAGKLKPKRAADKALIRIRTMCWELEKLIEEHAPDRVVVEVPSGKTHHRLGKNVSHLPIYGMAVGAVLATCWHLGLVTDTTADNEWTRGKPKDDRKAYIAGMFKSYDASQDKGGDVADAIGLMLWKFDKLTTEAA
jgi:Holliday junction resolvasome RuvABC endonuclease subunit